MQYLILLMAILYAAPALAACPAVQYLAGNVCFDDAATLQAKFDDGSIVDTGPVADCAGTELQDAGGTCVTDLAELNTSLSTGLVTGAHTTDTGPTQDCAGTELQDAGGTCVTDLAELNTSLSTGLVTGAHTDTTKLPLAGGTLTGELVLDNLGIDSGVAADTHTDCSAFPNPGGGIYYDLSEAVWKKCQENVLTDLDAGGAGDIISEGDSFVEVTDAAVGEVIIDVDDEDLEFKDGGANQIDVTSNTGVDTVDFSQGLQATSFTADASATPGIGWTDSDTTDEDVSAGIGVNCTDTATTTEDCDVTFTQQVAGSDVNYIVADADGNVTATTHSWVVGIQHGADPASCTIIGQLYFDTDETNDTACTTTADNSLCICTATGTPGTWASTE